MSDKELQEWLNNLETLNLGDNWEAAYRGQFGQRPNWVDFVIYDVMKTGNRQHAALRSERNTTHELYTKGVDAIILAHEVKTEEPEHKMYAGVAIRHKR